jgi:hypothetical protein
MWAAAERRGYLITQVHLRGQDEHVGALLIIDGDAAAGESSRAVNRSDAVLDISVTAEDPGWRPASVRLMRWAPRS